jgi:transcriptional regulator with XRE-family HTH domain
MRASYAGLLWLSVMAVWLPTLASIFRRRLRDLLDARHAKQVDLARAVDLSQGRLSSILKYDKHAATITIDRLAAIATFFSVSPAELVRHPHDQAMTLTDTEAKLIELVRQLPEDQRVNLLNLLSFTFSTRQEASQERALLRVLRANLAREMAERFPQKAR